MKIRLILLLFLVCILCNYTRAQSPNATIKGIVTDAQNKPMEYVSVSVKGLPIGTTTATDGTFQLRFPADTEHTFVFSFIGYETKTFTLFFRQGEVHNIRVVLSDGLTTLPDVEVRDRQLSSGQYTRIDPRLSAIIPGPGSGVENLIKTMPGVSSTSELSSQYSVRGGNFDENLVYVNGIEIYRPFLIRSGQQEGLSFINSDLVSSITFSAGGFDAEYGDKMSSVLDITYIRPVEFAGSFTMSLLEGSIHIEDALQNGRLKYLMGLRHKSNQYLLGTFDTQGNYQPRFTDFQTFASYELSPSWELNFLGNYYNNQYLFIPETQTTRFGTVSDVKQFTVFFQGQESDRFVTALGALSLNYSPEVNQKYQLIGSVFQTDETENFDIFGQYLLEQVEADRGSAEFGQPVGNPLGVGSFLNHARNYLNAIVFNLEHKAEVNTDNNTLKWGVKFQHEDIFDRLSEWSLIDSAGYALPRQPDHSIVMQDTVNSRINLQSSRYSGFVQHSWLWDTDRGRYVLVTGIRSQYWNLNHQWIVSPRVTLLHTPDWAPQFVFRASAGYYQQPAFYREMRDFEGNINKNLKAQQSFQVVLGTEYNLQIWDRPFKYTAEIYYKRFNNLVPYEVNNLRIRYQAHNDAKGYARGLDMKIHGEFVPGIESWASLSVMKTEEIIEGSYYTDTLGIRRPLGYLPRPTDQRVAFSLFFQDFLPRNPSYKVSLALFYGSGVPITYPTQEKKPYVNYMPPYRRVDIGFSKELIGNESRFGENGPFRHIESMWITAEVFNLLKIKNTISYLWIRDVENRMYAVPNYLTSRLINVKLVTRF